MKEDKTTKDIMQLLDEMSDEDLIANLRGCTDYGWDGLFEAAGYSIDEYLKIPTVEQILKTGSGLELDNIAEKYKFKTSRWQEETDSSFRSRLWVEFYNGVWETEE